MQPDELEQHMDHCRKITGHYFKKWHWAMSYDEIFSEALLGLVQAMKRHDPNKEGASFNAFSSMRIEGQIKDGIRNRIGRQDKYHNNRDLFFNALSLNKETEEGDADEFDIEDVSALQAFDDAGSNLPTMGEMVQFLTKKERQIIKLCYVEDLNLTDASRRMGVSYFKAKFLHDRTIEKLRFFVPRARYA